MSEDGETALAKLEEAVREFKIHKHRRALSKLEEAIRKFQTRDDRRVDLKRLREVIDGLKYELFFQEWTSQIHRGRPVGRLDRDRS